MHEEDDRDREIINWEAAFNSKKFNNLRKKKFALSGPIFVLYTALFFILWTIQNYYPEVATFKVWGNVNFAFLYTMLLFPIFWITGFYYCNYIIKKIHPLEDEMKKEFGRR